MITPLQQSHEPISKLHMIREEKHFTHQSKYRRIGRSLCFCSLNTAVGEDVRHKIRQRGLIVDDHTQLT